MSWMELVARDPVPWLLDPSNPSARYLTLREIFKRSDADLREEQERILAWPPVQAILRHWDKLNHWGRAPSPYYGGPLGNFGTLYLLTQLGAPRFPEAVTTCENLLAQGRHEDVRFQPEAMAAAPWLAYTGMALQILLHFGFEDDPRAASVWRSATATIRHDPQYLDCPVGDRSCPSGAVKLLSAFLQRPPDRRTADDQEAIELLGTYLVNFDYDWQGPEHDWLQPRFPRYYDTDIVELCHALVMTPRRDEAVFQVALKRVLALQNEAGQWSKLRATPALSEERIFQPSRWLTFEAVHTLMVRYGDESYAT